MKAIFLFLFLSCSLVTYGQQKNVTSRNDFPSGWMAIGSSGENMNITWTIQNLNGLASGARVNVVLLYNIPRGWVIVGVDTSMPGSQFQKTVWTLLNANGYTRGSRINVVSMENVDQSMWKQVGFDNNAVTGAKYTLENIGGGNGPSPSSGNNNSGSTSTAQQMNHQKTGTVLPILSCVDVESVDIYVQPLTGSNRQQQYLGEYPLLKNYNFFLEQDINYCTKPIWTNDQAKYYNKKATLPIGRYKLIAIEKTSESTTRKCEKIIDITENSCTAVNVNFDYGTLYLYLQTRIDYPVVKLAVSDDYVPLCLQIDSENYYFVDYMVKVTIDGGSRVFRKVNSTQKNAQHCGNSQDDPLVLPPGTHEIKFELVKYKNGIEDKSNYVTSIQIKPNQCLSFDLYLDNSIND